MLKYIIAAFVFLASSSAMALRYERVVGLDGGLVFPSFASPSPTAFTLASWDVGGVAEYGVTHDLFVQAGFRFASFSGDATDYTVEREGRPYTGVLAFLGRFYHPEIGLRYQLLGGYNLAPHLVIRGGYLWAAYHDAVFTTDDGRDFGLEVGDFAEGAFTVSMGMSVDYRLLNVAFVGVALRYTRLVGDTLFRHYFSAPITVSYYW